MTDSNRPNELFSSTDDMSHENESMYEQFKGALKTIQTPLIEDCLIQVPTEDQSALLAGLLNLAIDYQPPPPNFKPKQSP